LHKIDPESTGQEPNYMSATPNLKIGLRLSNGI